MLVSFEENVLLQEEIYPKVEETPKKNATKGILNKNSTNDNKKNSGSTFKEVWGPIDIIKKETSDYILEGMVEDGTTAPGLKLTFRILDGAKKPKDDDLKFDSQTRSFYDLSTGLYHDRET